MCRARVPLWRSRTDQVVSPARDDRVVERTDDDVFVVRPATAGGWDAIAAGLARLLVRLAACDARHCVVVDSVERQYVQLMWLPDGDLWAEANLQPAVDEASTE